MVNGHADDDHGDGDHGDGGHDGHAVLGDGDRWWKSRWERLPSMTWHSQEAASLAQQPQRQNQLQHIRQNQQNLPIQQNQLTQQNQHTQQNLLTQQNLRIQHIQPILLQQTIQSLRHQLQSLTWAPLSESWWNFLSDFFVDLWIFAQVAVVLLAVIVIALGILIKKSIITVNP